MTTKDKELACVDFAKKYFKDGVDPLLLIEKPPFYRLRYMSQNQTFSENKTFGQLWSDFGLRDYGIDYWSRGRITTSDKLECLEFWIKTLYDGKIIFSQVYNKVVEQNLNIRLEFRKNNPHGHITTVDVEDGIPQYVDFYYGTYDSTNTFLELINKLYSDDNEIAISTIQDKANSQTFESEVEAYHTGVSFKACNGHNYELFYIFKSKKLFVQVTLNSLNSDSRILGTVWKKDNDNYFRAAKSVYVDGIEEVGGRLAKIDFSTLSFTELKENRFYFFSEEYFVKSVISSFVRSKKFPAAIFFPKLEFYIDLCKIAKKREYDDKQYDSWHSTNSNWSTKEELNSWDKDFPGWREGRDC